MKAARNGLRCWALAVVGFACYAPAGQSNGLRGAAAGQTGRLQAGALGGSMRQVLMDHDGGAPDDYMAAALLLTMPHIESLGFVVTPADCYPEAAVRVTRKLLGLLHQAHLPVASSDVPGRNPFPTPWREGSRTFDSRITAADPRPDAPAASGTELMSRVLREAAAPVTLLVTGPLSTVAAVLERDPKLAANIETIVWMGGALDVPGNVNPEMEPDHDGSAEWNAYWDPDAVQAVWRTTIPIVLCPLDVTNKVPVTHDFVETLRAQAHHPLSRIATTGYEMMLGLAEVSLWDVLAAAYLAVPELFEVEEAQTAVQTTGPSQGRIMRQAGGRSVQVLRDVDAPAVLRYVLGRWAR